MSPQDKETFRKLAKQSQQEFLDDVTCLQKLGFKVSFSSSATHSYKEAMLVYSTKLRHILH